MEHYDTIKNDLYDRVIDYYRLDRELSLRHLRDLAIKLDRQGLSPTKFRLSNGDSGFDGYFRVFPSIKEFLIHCPDIDDGIYINDFGAQVFMNGTKYSLTFSLPGKLVIQRRGNYPVDALVEKLSVIIQSLE